MKCPACGHDIKSKKEPYTTEFEAFWTAYDTPKNVQNASKSEAMKAWTQIKDQRPSQPRILVALQGYLTYIRKHEQPACHPATWLRQGRYENFLPVENSHTDTNGESKPVTSFAGWPSDIANSLVKHIGEPKFKVWLGDAKFTPGDMENAATISVNTDLKRNYLETKLASALSSCVGYFQVVLEK